MQRKYSLLHTKLPNKMADRNCKLNDIHCQPINSKGIQFCTPS